MYDNTPLINNLNGLKAQFDEAYRAQLRQLKQDILNLQEKIKSARAERGEHAASYQKWMQATQEKRALASLNAPVTTLNDFCGCLKTTVFQTKLSLDSSQIVLLRDAIQRIKAISMTMATHRPEDTQASSLALTGVAGLCLGVAIMLLVTAPLLAISSTGSIALAVGFLLVVIGIAGHWALQYKSEEARMAELTGPGKAAYKFAIAFESVLDQYYSTSLLSRFPCFNKRNKFERSPLTATQITAEGNATP